MVDVVLPLFNDNEYMNYSIHLHQEGGEIQNLGQSDSLKEITEMWEAAKIDDDYGWLDEEITLRGFVHIDENDEAYAYGEMIDCYTIPKSQ